MNISLEEVKWTFMDPTTGKKTVYLYFQGEDFLHQQSDDFKDRTSLFKEELSSGNCSLSLLVTTSHNGSYQSYVGGRLCCTVNLKVLPAEEDSSEDDPVSPDKPNMLQCQNTTIEGKAGDTVILPCSTKNKMNISLEEVEWTFMDPTTGKKTVHLYFQGKDQLHQQSDDFKDRTSLFKEELSSGNCSLSLLATTSHNGSYQSYVGGRLCCTVNLKVLPAEEDSSEDDPVSPDKPNMLQCQNTTIEGKAGDTVILPCSTKNKMNIRCEEVKWTFMDPTTGKKTVHLYFQGEDDLHQQSDDFKDRTSLFKEELSSGNCSLRLRVTTSHNGSYQSYVGGRLCCTVNLKVLPAEEDSSEDDPVSPDKPNMLQCQNTTIEGKAGDTVILPCSTKNKMNIRCEEVKWTFMDPTTGKKTVHLYFQGEDYLHQQSDDFKDRTSLFKEELSSGNCSLSLLATTSHNGSYQSCVGGRLCCTVNLKVLPAEEDSSEDDPVSPDKPNMLQCQNTTIEGKAGDTVILPCSTKNKMNISLEEVKWTFMDPTTGKKTVHLYFQGKDQLHQQSDDFKDRTSLFKEELSSGNCSLSLLATTSHNGSYQSYVGGRLCCTVNLKVLPAEEDSSEDDPVSPDKPNMLQCQNTTIEGKAGDTVILPCSTKNKMNISLEEVEWTFMDPTTGKKTVHLYFQGKDYLHQQSDDFKDRTSLFKEELSSGNCSLSLLATTSHNGSYQSYVGGRLCCTVNLKVLPAEEDSSEDDPVSPDKPNMLQCQNTTIEGKAGDTVILPCSTKNKMNISLEEVKWTFMDPTTGKKTVHLYFQGKDDLHQQSDDFKDRTSLFKEELSSGNCSLRLRVTTSHNGSYQSYVGGRLCCTVNLKVLPAEEDSSEDDPVSPDKPNMLQCQNTTIEGKAGDTVILPCSTKNKMDISLEEVKWTFMDPTTGKKTVHLYFQGEDYLHQQSDDFKDRTSLFKEELSSGNCSLSLLATTSHNGSYQSYVGGRLCCTVNLKVLPAEEDSSEDDPVSPDKPNNGTDGQNNIIGGVVGGVLGVAALIIIITLAYRHREQLKNCCSGTNSNNPQIYQDIPLQALQPPEDEENEPVDQNPNEEQIQMLENEEQDDPADGK
ncbi:uncharacterized protein LOC115577643 [Sparus aurata]|uniref:uncharacterized protein LOC115577643 n=1 Tax=Sparus aurata TaxID=8175 RepID=UPI0011C17F44|nr:uncharacterized protein LOC115577643 [Sparus aurata]